MESQTIYREPEIFWHPGWLCHFLDTCLLLFIYMYSCVYLMRLIPSFLIRSQAVSEIRGTTRKHYRLDIIAITLKIKWQTTVNNSKKGNLLPQNFKCFLLFLSISVLEDAWSLKIDQQALIIKKCSWFKKNGSRDRLCFSFNQTGYYAENLNIPKPEERQYPYVDQQHSIWWFNQYFYHAI